MTEPDRVKYLRIVLLVVGVIFIVGIYPLTILWPSGWSWNTGQSEYLQMILGIYATLGVFLVIASRNPSRTEASLWFMPCGRALTFVHAGIMAAQSGRQHAVHVGHLWGDVLALFVVAAVLALFTPRGAATAI